MSLEYHFNILHETSSPSLKNVLPKRFCFYACANAQIQRQVRIYIKIINEELKGPFFVEVGNLNL